MATTVKSGVLSLTNSPTETWRLATTPVSGAGTTVSVRRFRPSSTAASRWRTSASAALMAPRSASSWDSARAHLIPVLAERGLGHLDERLGGLGLRAGLVDVARRDQLLGQELLVPLELAALPLGVGAGPLDVGREGPAAVPDPLEVGAARVRRRRARAKFSRARAEVRLELVDREVRLAAVQVRERLAFPDGVPEVDVEPDDRARELRAGDGLLPGEEAPDRVDAPLDRAALDEGGRDAEGRGLGRRRAALRRPGRARLRRGAARDEEPPESDEQDGGQERAGGGAAGGPGSWTPREAFIVPGG